LSSIRARSSAVGHSHALRRLDIVFPIGRLGARLKRGRAHLAKVTALQRGVQKALRGGGAAGALGDRVAQVAELGLAAQERHPLVGAEAFRRELVGDAVELLDDG
jgi:hypothetical protein